MSKTRKLWAYIKPYWHLELLTFVVMIILAGLMLAVPVSVQYMIDTLIPSLINQTSGDIDFSKIVTFGLFLMGIYLGQVGFSWLRDYLAAYIGANIIAHMRSRLFSHLERLPLAFFQSHQVGEVMSRFLSDINAIQGLLVSTILMLLTNVILLTGILTYLITIEWKLTLIAVIPVPVTIFVVKKLGIRLHTINRMIQETTAAFSALLQESFLAIKTVKAFGREDTEKDKVDTAVIRMTDLYVKNSVLTSLIVFGVNFLNMLGPIVVLAWGTYLVASGEMLLGALIAFYMLLTYLYSPIQGLASVHIEIQRAMASVDRVFEYFDIPQTIIDPENPIALDAVSGAIEFRNVKFAYDPETTILDDLNLKIQPNEKVAIVGPSGAGKTTIINLLLRFYDPLSGAVRIDGIDLRDISIKTLRKHIALVDQEPLLFKTSIFNNIAYSVVNAKPEDVIRAAKVANVHSFIDSLPNKYDTEVGERGVTISGGEKQRICLARAILKNPAIVILDEATSALDSSSELLIQDALDGVLQDKTAIIIAHRLSTVQHADRIIAIDDGRLVGEGSHQELLKKSDLYRTLASNQLLV